jgi:hypothetical protein
MKKLALDLDGLRVDSFSTSPQPDVARGTVHGLESPRTNDPTLPSGCGCGSAACTATCG